MTRNGAIELPVDATRDSSLWLVGPFQPGELSLWALCNAKFAFSAELKEIKFPTTPWRQPRGKGWAGCLLGVVVLSADTFRRLIKAVEMVEFRECPRETPSVLELTLYKY